MVLGGLEGGREDTRGGTWVEVGEHIPLWFLAFTGKSNNKKTRLIRKKLNFICVNLIATAI